MEVIVVFSMLFQDNVQFSSFHQHHGGLATRSLIFFRVEFYNSSKFEEKILQMKLDTSCKIWFVSFNTIALYHAFVISFIVLTQLDTVMLLLC